MDANGTLRNFVTKWIDDHYQRPGEMPKDFSLLETELPKLQEMLEEERIFVSLRWLKQRAEELFNLHVGIEKVVNLDYDRQLQEAIRIIKADEIEKHFDPMPEDSELPSTTQATPLIEHEPTADSE